MKLIKITFALFVFKFAFSAQAALNCQSLLESKEVAAEYSAKMLKRAWSELSLTDQSKEEEAASFRVIWEPYKAMIDNQISQLAAHNHLRSEQKKWLALEMTAELVEQIETQRKVLRHRWEFSKTFLEKDLDRHKEMLDEINEDITQLTTDQVAWENTYNALIKFTPKLNYVDHFRVH